MIYRSIFLVILCWGFSGKIFAQELSAEKIISQLTWMSGHWVGETWETHYTSPKGNNIFSITKNFRGEKLVSFEYERFFIQGGKIILSPYPSGKQSPAIFTLTDYDPSKKIALFVNEKHDWPQRIKYEIDGDGKFKIKVSGTDTSNGMYREFTLLMSKVK